MPIPQILLAPYQRALSILRSSATLRRITVSSSVLIAVIGLFWFASSGKSGADNDVIVTPKRGEFFVTVTTTGELQAKSSIQVMGPQNARAASIWQMKMTNLVPEGTVVKKGDFIAELDKSEITGKFKDSQLSVQKFEAQYTQTQLDSVLSLSQARDELINLHYA